MDNDLDFRNQLSGLLDEYLTLDESEDVSEEPSSADEPSSNVELPKRTSYKRISYPQSTLGPAAHCMTKLCSSLVNETVVQELGVQQTKSLQQARSAQRDLRKANKHLREMYPIIKVDIERCMDLLTKIHLDRDAIDACVQRSRNILKVAGY
jgi:hypothetical protein